MPLKRVSTSRAFQCSNNSAHRPTTHPSALQPISATDSPLLILYAGHTFGNCSTSLSIHHRLVGRLRSSTRPHKNLRRKFRRAMRTPPSYPHQQPQSSQNAHSVYSRTLIRPHLYFVPCPHILTQPMATPLLLSPTQSFHWMRIPSLP